MKKKLIVVTSIGAAGIILFVAPTIYLLHRIEQASIELQNTQGELSLLSKKFENLSVWGEDVSDVAGSLGVLDEFFVDPSDLLVLVQALEDLAHDSNVGLDISNLAVDASKNSSGDVVSRLSVSGPYESCMRFLNRVENMMYLSEIEDVTISDPELVSGVEMSIKVRFIVYED